MTCPRMLLYLSSRRYRVRGREGAKYLSRDVALQATHHLLGRATLGSASRDVGAGRGVDPHAHGCHGRQRLIQAAIAATVEAVAHGVA